MGLIERFQQAAQPLVPQLSRVSPDSCCWAALHYGVKAAICSPNSPWRRFRLMADGSAHDRRLPVHAGLVP